jgi:4-hydroxythreonine-4-phosphate dehydrogenase
VVVYGSVAVLDAAMRHLRAIGVPIGFSSVVSIREPSGAAALAEGVLGVIDVAPTLEVATPYPWGEAIPEFGALQYAALLRAIDDAMGGTICGVFTAPWHKARLADAGLPPTGHTEVLEERSGAEEAVMLLAGDLLRVALATIHIPLREVANRLTTPSIVRTGRILAAGLRQRYGIGAPRIALCGLNPHAGEDGVLGSEDAEIVAPAVAELQALGIDAFGPVPADTLFPRIVAGKMRADAVLAMYHDQGLGPLKTIHFGESANITLGLPFVRTSVDHGTAYDIAGRGEADTGSFLYAAKLALEMASRAKAP